MFQEESFNGTRWSYSSHIECVCLWTQASLIWDVDDTHQQQCKMSQPSPLLWLQRMSLTQTQVNEVWSLLIHLYVAFCEYTSPINHCRHLILVSKLALLIVNDAGKPKGAFTWTMILLQLWSILYSKKVAVDFAFMHLVDTFIQSDLQ